MKRLALSGVTGGAIAFVAIGIFIGPALLAVSRMLPVAWVGDIDRGPILSK